MTDADEIAVIPPSDAVAELTENPEIVAESPEETSTAENAEVEQADGKAEVEAVEADQGEGEKIEAEIEKEEVDKEEGDKEEVDKEAVEKEEAETDEAETEETEDEDKEEIDESEDDTDGHKASPSKESVMSGEDAERDKSLDSGADLADNELTITIHEHQKSMSMFPDISLFAIESFVPSFHEITDPIEQLKITENVYKKIIEALEAKLSVALNKNRFLSKRIAEYLRKRKGYHSSESQGETQKTYEKELRKMLQANEAFHCKQIETQEKMKSLAHERTVLKTKAHNLFRLFVQTELEAGKDVIFSSAVMKLDEVVDRHIKRQKAQFNELIKMRLKYIKTRNIVHAKQEQINSLDNLGPDLRLLDYEQLKMTNRISRDKLEERYNDLNFLRYKCENASQIYAHRCEKAYGVEKDLEALRSERIEVNRDYEMIRSHVNYAKQHRDSVRKKISLVKEKGGLLMRPKLLVDITKTNDEIQLLEKHVSKLQNRFNSNALLLSKLKGVDISEDHIRELRLHHKMSYLMPDKSRSTVNLQFNKIRQL